ncbi:MAG: hypothetical protein IJM44_05085 [Ruminococcus sp.]|nr:hypothetical protein [Ruminococcus sp.]
MIFNDLLTTMAQTSDIDQPTLFPFPFGMHLCFALISLVFFVYRFVTDKRPYQLILAIAIPLSLTIWISENRKLFYIIGAVELVLLIAALVTSIVFKKPEDTAADDDDDDDDADAEEAPAVQDLTEVAPAEAPAEKAAEVEDLREVEE